MTTDPASPEPLTAEQFRVLAEGRLYRSPSDAVFDPRSGRTWGRSDFDLNPDMLADFAVMEPARDAAVPVPIVIREELTVLLTQRTNHLATHAGQIAFPGGKVEPSDADALAAALREAEEEVGLMPRFVEPLGYLDSYRTDTGYLVVPVVALVQPHFELRLDPGEVVEVFEVPLRFLMNEANHLKQARPWRGRERHYYAMPYGERYIWGATAGMLKNLHQKLFET